MCSKLEINVLHQKKKYIQINVSELSKSNHCPNHWDVTEDPFQQNDHMTQEKDMQIFKQEHKALRLAYFFMFYDHNLVGQKWDFKEYHMKRMRQEHNVCNISFNLYWYLTSQV